jgi:glycosyltransferase involved in cell wall biosynthesis
MLGRRSPNILLFIHSVLAQIRGWRSRNPFYRACDMRAAVNAYGNRGVHYCVLEHSIRTAMLEELPALDALVSALPHPLSEAELWREPRKTLASPMNFGFVGRALKEKGFELFLELAERIKDSQPELAEFHALGWLPKSTADARLAILTTKPHADRTIRSEYVAAIRSMDYVVVPYREVYGLIASGSLLDAVAAARPIIVPAMPLTRDLFNRYGDIGYIFSDGELPSLVEKLITLPDPARFRRQVENLAILAADRLPQALAKTFQTIVRDFR